MHRRLFQLDAVAALIPPPVLAADKSVHVGSRTTRRGVDRNIIYIGIANAALDHIMPKVIGKGILIYDVNVIYSTADTIIS